MPWVPQLLRKSLSGFVVENTGLSYTSFIPDPIETQVKVKDTQKQIHSISRIGRSMERQQGYGSVKLLRRT